jgi:hypothetical protein
MKPTIAFNFKIGNQVCQKEHCKENLTHGTTNMKQELP